VYSCFCTHEELEAERRRALANNKPYRYGGKCFELKPDEREAKKAEGRPFTLRFRVEEGIVKFQDLVYGEKVFDAATIGDFVLARSNEMPLYLFTCAVDDCLMKITHVIRGEDGISNTPRQIMIQRALGFESPQFAHLPLILGPDHTLLSKRNGSMSVAELRAKGYLPRALLNYLGLLGWSPPEGKEFLNLDQMVQSFDLHRVSRSSAIFDWGKLNHLNHLHLMKLPETEYLEMARQALAAAGFDASTVPAEILDKTLLAVRPNIQTLSDVNVWVNWLLKVPTPAGAEAEEVLKSPEARKVLQAALDQLQSVSEDIDARHYETLMETLKKVTKIKGKKLFMPLRVVLTGSTEGPELAQLVGVLGKEKILERIQRGLESLQ
ncbi:MAG: glutamate--tRNA ligase, partial [Candidatus Binatia bacterium]